MTVLIHDSGRCRRLVNIQPNIFCREHEKRSFRSHDAWSLRAYQSGVLHNAWQSAKGGAMSAKRGWVLFGAKSAHEPAATARALAEGSPPDTGRVEKDAKLPRYI